MTANETADARGDVAPLITPHDRLTPTRRQPTTRPDPRSRNPHDHHPTRFPHTTRPASISHTFSNRPQTTVNSTERDGVSQTSQSIPALLWGQANYPLALDDDVAKAVIGFAALDLGL